MLKRALMVLLLAVVTVSPIRVRAQAPPTPMQVAEAMRPCLNLPEISGIEALAEVRTGGVYDLEGGLITLESAGYHLPGYTQRFSHPRYQEIVLMQRPISPEWAAPNLQDALAYSHYQGSIYGCFASTFP
jgi:hypothetical protein